MDRLHVVDRAFPAAPPSIPRASRALLGAVASGERPETLRLYRPGRRGRVLDAPTRSGRASPRRSRAARGAGFDAALRLAGGSAAVFHRETLAFGWCRPAPDPRLGIRARFEEMAELVARALHRLGVDARVGAVPGEYCPGDHSVNAGGRTKLMGVGQRIVRGASWVGGVIVVGATARADAALSPVYAALGLPYDPGATGSVEDEIGPVEVATVRDALLAELAVARELASTDFDDVLLEVAAQLEPRHRAQGRGA